jgi:hypothetical protein
MVLVACPVIETDCSNLYCDPAHFRFVNQLSEFKLNYRVIVSSGWELRGTLSIRGTAITR